MTVAENLARLFSLHYQRIVELAHEHGTEASLDEESVGRWRDLASLFLFDAAEEGFWYWWALAKGEGVKC